MLFTSVVMRIKKLTIHCSSQSICFTPSVFIISILICHTNAGKVTELEDIRAMVQLGLIAGYSSINFVLVLVYEFLSSMFFMLLIWFIWIFVWYCPCKLQIK